MYNKQTEGRHSLVFCWTLNPFSETNGQKYNGVDRILNIWTYDQRNIPLLMGSLITLWVQTHFYVSTEYMSH